MNTQKAQYILDQVVPAYLDFMQTQQGRTDWVATVFQDRNEEARSHIKDHWHSKEYQFDEFYLNLDDKNQRAMLEFFKIRVEPDPYPDAADRMIAQAHGESPWNCHPFETYTLFVFLRFAYNNSLDIVEEFEGGPEALELSQVERRGNGINWGTFYHYLITRQQDDLRTALVDMIVARG